MRREYESRIDEVVDNIKEEHGESLALTIAENKRRGGQKGHGAERRAAD